MLNNTANTGHTRQTGKSSANEAFILQKVSEALKGMQYGEIVIKVEKGSAVFVDRHERIRIG